MRKQSSRWDMIFQLCQITAMNCFNKELMSVTMIVFPTKLLFGRVIYYFYIWSDRVIDTIRDWQFFPCIFIFSWGKIVFHCTVDRNTLIHSLSLYLPLTNILTMNRLWTAPPLRAYWIKQWLWVGWRIFVGLPLQRSRQAESINRINSEFTNQYEGWQEYQKN